MQCTSPAEGHRPPTPRLAFPVTAKQETQANINAGTDALRANRPNYEGLLSTHGDRPPRFVSYMISYMGCPARAGIYRPLSVSYMIAVGFPARAGIDLPLEELLTAWMRFPRTRRDRPATDIQAYLDAKAPPHARGSTLDLFHS